MLKIHTLFFMVIFILIGCFPVENKKNLSTSPQCLKSQSNCLVETKFGKVEILFNQEKILTELPFQIYLKMAALSNANDIVSEGRSAGGESKLSHEILKVNSYIEGREMFMGKIPVFFSPLEHNEGMFAETLLGSCSQDKMVWRLWLTVFFENNEINSKIDKGSLQETFFIDFTSSRF